MQRPCNSASMITDKPKRTRKSTSTKGSKGDGKHPYPSWKPWERSRIKRIKLSDDPGASGRATLTSKVDKLLPASAGHLQWARRLKDLMRQHVLDLGGLENISQAELLLVRRAATLTIECERFETKFCFAEGGPDAKQLDAYQRAANSLRRLLTALGIKRRAKDITPDIATPLEYARSRQ